MVEAEARRKGLELLTAFDPTTPHRAMLAGDLVQQVLVNLLMNAVKFTSAGSVTLRIKGNTERLRFEVADMGPGIPAGKRRGLFGKSDRPDHDGPDLLWIIQRFVSRMGGQIGVAANPGGGTVFWLVLPTAAADAFIAPDATATTNPPGATLQQHRPARQIHALRILLADDMELTRLVATDYLRSAGHTVTEVGDGEMAIAAVQNRDFDVVLTDMRMPIIDGLEVTRRIRALPGQRGRTPVVLVTANLIANEHVASGGTGVDVCVMKPFTRAELLAAVETAARLMPVPERHATADPVLDRYILIELRDSLGAAGFATQVEVMIHRIEDLLALLGSPGATQNPALCNALHDLGGGSGLFGLTALSSSLRRFDVGHGGAASAAALREVAIRSAQALQQILQPAALAYR
jgi:CheY-like chemotaxis protein